MTSTKRVTRGHARGRTGVRSFLRETAIIVISALVLSWLIKTFLVQAFYIPSGSMEPTLEVGDRILVNKLAPSPSTIHRGDVVVFLDPGGWIAPGEQTSSNPVSEAIQDALTFIGLLPQDAGSHLVKRVIGLPGDEVACCSPDGKLTVNGVAIDEPYIMPGDSPSDITFDVTVPKDSVWVMGDHRSDSADSRYHMQSSLGGAVPMKNIVGRVFLIIWPLSHAGKLPSAQSTFAGVPDP